MTMEDSERGMLEAILLHGNARDYNVRKETLKNNKIFEIEMF
jgi:hypothetical protein